MKLKINQQTAKIHESFVSLQGEGCFVGERQIFLRFSRCNMACRYCDTNNEIGSEQSMDRIISNLEKLYWQNDGIKAVTFTGGEPLLYSQAIMEAGEWAHHLGMRNFLETNATLPQALGQVLPVIDVVSLDLKIPSVGQTKAYWREHEACLKQIGAMKKYCYIKLVVSQQTEPEELNQALDLVAGYGIDWPVYLQPVTALNGILPPSLSRLEEFKQRAYSKLYDVRVQPQWHKYWGIK